MTGQSEPYNQVFANQSRNDSGEKSERICGPKEINEFAAIGDSSGEILQNRHLKVPLPTQSVLSHSVEANSAEIKNDIYSSHNEQSNR